MALIANQFKMDPRVVAASSAADRVILSAAYAVAARDDADFAARFRGGL